MNKHVASAALAAALVNLGCAASPNAVVPGGAAPTKAAVSVGNVAASAERQSVRLTLLDDSEVCDSETGTGTGTESLTGTGVDSTLND